VSENEEVAAAAVEEPAVEETAVAETEAVVEDAVAEELVAQEPVAETPVTDEPVAEEPEPEVEVTIEDGVATVPLTAATSREARVYLCERGHRTLKLWGDPPPVCQARPTRSGGICGRPIYHMTELPEQVQKALNPLKASKKKAGKK
jgi:hypothetical protein